MHIASAGTIERFTAQATRAASIVHHPASLADVAQLADRCAAGTTIALAPTVADRHPSLVSALGSRALVVHDTSDPRALADAPVGIVAGDLAIAETGSVLVDNTGFGDRLVSMFPLIVIQVVRVTDLRSDLDDAATWLSARIGQPGFAQLVTGPSRTADIERSLTIGVQGPNDLHIALLADEDVA